MASRATQTRKAMARAFRAGALRQKTTSDKSPATRNQTQGGSWRKLSRVNAAMPPKLARTLTLYAATPLGAFSRYQPTNWPKGINEVAITANRGTIKLMARSIPVQLVGIAGTPQT